MPDHQIRQTCSSHCNLDLWLFENRGTAMLSTPKRTRFTFWFGFTYCSSHQRASNVSVQYQTLMLSVQHMSSMICALTHGLVQSALCLDLQFLFVFLISSYIFYDIDSTGKFSIDLIQTILVRAKHVWWDFLSVSFYLRLEEKGVKSKNRAYLSIYFLNKVIQPFSWRKSISSFSRK